VRVLAVNAGSTSVKLTLLDPHDVVVGTDTITHTADVADGIRRLAKLADGAGYVIPARAKRYRDAIGKALDGMDSVGSSDTAFHKTIPPAAALDAKGKRRPTSHGLAHEYASRQATGLSRVVSCCLGGTASVCAVQDGQSVDTMELTSSVEALAGTADMRDVLERADGEAWLALEAYAHSVRCGIGAMVATLGGLDAIVFTGGVGERSGRVRELACEGLGYLGVAIDSRRNNAIDGDAEVGTRTARVFVTQAREDLEIARRTRAMLRGA
jgi:acetate kinase